MFMTMLFIEELFVSILVIEEKIREGTKWNKRLAKVNLSNAESVCGNLTELLCAQEKSAKQLTRNI